MTVHPMSPSAIEDARRDVFALLTVQLHAPLDSNDAAREALRTIVSPRPGESEVAHALRVTRTFDLLSLMTTTALELAAGLHPDSNVTSASLLAGYANHLETTSARRVAQSLRTWSGRISPSNYACPECNCRKSGYVDEPNGRDESCTDESCPCHDEYLIPQEGDR